MASRVPPAAGHLGFVLLASLIDSSALSSTVVAIMFFFLLSYILEVSFRKEIPNSELFSGRKEFYSFCHMTPITFHTYGTNL